VNSCVITHDRAGVRTIVIDRPEKLNALGRRAHQELGDEIARADQDDHVRCIVLTSTGKHFSAGSDLDDTGPGGAADTDTGEYLLGPLTDCRKPVVAAVRGVAIGIGLTMLGHVDMVVFGESARMKAPFVSLGLCPEAGSSETLPRLLGAQLAADVFYTCRWLDAAEAVAAGLGSRIVPDEHLANEVQRMAESVAAHPVETLVVTKALLAAGRVARAADARRRENQRFAELVQSEAYLRAMAAWRSR